MYQFPLDQLTKKTIESLQGLEQKYDEHRSKSVTVELPKNEDEKKIKLLQFQLLHMKTEVARLKKLYETVKSAVQAERNVSQFVLEDNQKPMVVQYRSLSIEIE